MQDGCPYKELSVTLNVGRVALSLKLSSVPIPSGYPDNEQKQAWPKLPHAATQPRAHLCRWSPSQVIQITSEVAPHCAFAVTGPYFSDRNNWATLLEALRVQAPPAAADAAAAATAATAGRATGAGATGSTSAAGRAAAAAGRAAGAAGSAAGARGGGTGAAAGVDREEDEQSCQESATAGSVRDDWDTQQPGSPGQQQQQEAGCQRSAAASGQQQKADTPLPFECVLAMRIAGLHVDTHIKLLLVPADPPRGGPPVLLGYLMLYTWQATVEDMAVPPSCSITYEAAQRCLTGLSHLRANKGAWGVCLAQQESLDPLTGIPLQEALVQCTQDIRKCTPHGMFDYVMHPLKRGAGSPGEGTARAGADSGGGGGGAGRRTPGARNTGCGAAAAAGVRQPAFWQLQPLLAGMTDEDLDKRLLVECKCPDEYCAGKAMREQLLKVMRCGVQCKLCIKDTRSGTGLGVFALNRIPNGTVLGLYAGEVTTREESDVREKKLYASNGLLYTWSLQPTNECDDSSGADGETQYIMDATFMGNFTRFINHSRPALPETGWGSASQRRREASPLRFCPHSCEPNTASQNICLGDIQEPYMLPVLLASRDIEPGEELTVDYCPIAREWLEGRWQRQQSKRRKPTGVPMGGGAGGGGDGGAPAPQQSRPATLLEALEPGMECQVDCRCRAARCRGKIFLMDAAARRLHIKAERKRDGKGARRRTARSRSGASKGQAAGGAAAVEGGQAGGGEAAADDD